MSRRTLCLWLLAASLCVALVAGGVGLAQQASSGTRANDPFSAPSAEDSGVAQSGAAAASSGRAVDAAAKPASSRPREGSGVGASYGGGGGEYGAAPAGGGTYGGSRYGGAAAPYGASRYSAQQPGSYSGYYTYAKAKGRKPDPEMDKLLKEDARMEAHAQSLVKQWREETDEKAKADLRTELQELTKEHFDLRQKRRELELSRLEEQLERVRASIKKRSEVKDLIIQRRMARLLGEEDDLAF